LDFNRAIELDARLAWAYEGRGVARMLKLDLEGAVNDFNRAIELDPKIANAYLNRGLALLLQGKDAAAESDFNRTLAINPALKEELEVRIKKADELRGGKK
jgi:lipoprotein NlpI